MKRVACAPFATMLLLIVKSKLAPRLSKTNKSLSQSMAPAAAADPNRAQAGSKERVAVLCKRGDGASTASVGLAPTWGTLAASCEDAIAKSSRSSSTPSPRKMIALSNATDRRWPPRPPWQAEPRHRPIAQPQSRRRRFLGLDSTCAKCSAATAAARSLLHTIP